MWGARRATIQRMNATGRALYVLAVMSTLIWLIRDSEAFAWVAFLALVGGWLIDAVGDTTRERGIAPAPGYARKAS